MYEALRDEIVEICRLSYDRGHVSATNGNISAKTPDDRGMIIKASGVCFARITADDLLFVDWAGDVLGCGDMLPTARKPSIELALHACLYPIRKEAGAVVHLHSPYATAFSFFGEIPLVVQEARHVLKRVPVIPACPAGSDELARAVRTAFSDPQTTTAVLCEHGPVAIGKDIQDAYNNIDTLEHNARVAHLTRALQAARPDEKAR